MDLKTKKILTIDCEYNNIESRHATKIWCISCVDHKTKKLYNFKPSKEGADQFHDQFADEFLNFVKDYDHFVGHNWWGAEAVVFKNLLGWEPTLEQVTDTLVWSRTIRPASPFLEQFGTFKKNGWDTRVGGHSIEAWGNRLGYPKDLFDQFDQFSFGLLKRCDGDAIINDLVLDALLKEKEEFKYSDLALAIESESHKLFQDQTTVGFTLHKKRAEKLVEDTGKLLEEYQGELHKVFPPIKIIVEVYKPKLKKDGTLGAAQVRKLQNSLHEDNGDGTYNICEMQVFNPKAPAQVAKRLIALGWKPRKFTDAGQASVAKEVIGEAIDLLAPKFPEVEYLRKYNIVFDKHGKASKWLELAADDGKVHGRVNHVGPWTHRCSHFDDNMANITKVKTGPGGKIIEGLDGDFGWESRHCWIPRDGWVLVGCDASGIQLRALAHYMGDEKYIKEVTTGDVHVANQHAAGITKGYLGMSPRDVAKRFIYAWLLGAGDEKIGMVVGTDPEEYDDLLAKAKKEFKYNRFRDHERKNGRTVYSQYDSLLWFVYDKLTEEGRASKDVAATIIKGYLTKKAFLDNLPALKRFKEVDIKEAAVSGFMYGLDGRKIWVPSEHLAMGAYLQGFEAVVMKHAMCLYQRKLKEKGIPFAQVCQVHDELQIECPKEHAEEVGKTVVWAIEEVGRLLGSLCPLTGEYRIGDSWAATH